MKKSEKLPELVIIGNRMADVRKAHGYKNYEHLAYDLGMSRTSYYRLESGENFEILSLIRVLKFLGVTLDEFFAGLKIPKVEKKKK